MASASAETVIMATEEVDWLIKDFHGLIIGSKGSGIKALKEKTGAQADFRDKRCMISGKEEDLEKAKSFIAEKVKKQERWLSKKGKLVSKSCVPLSLNMMKDEKWDNVPMPAKYFSQIVGKELQTKFEVNIRLRKFEKKSQIVMQGQPAAKERFLTFVQEFVEQKKKDERTIVIDDIPRKSFGCLIGKGGSIMKNLEAKHGVKISIKDEKIFLRGSEECCKAALAGIDALLKENESNSPGRNSPKRTIYFVGLEENDEVKLALAKTLSKDCIDAKHCDISWYPKVEIKPKKSFPNIPGLKKGLEDTMKKVKEACEKNEMAFGAITLHIGLVHYQFEPGSYKIAALRNSKLKNIVYERIPSDSLDLDKLNQLPIVNDYFRVDMKIVTPDRSSLRYKVFAKVVKSDVEFIDAEEAGVMLEEMVDIRVGPGYFCHSEDNFGKNDIIHPDSNFTMRLNVDLLKPEKYYDSIVKKHASILQNFLTNIVLKAVNGNVNVIFPDIALNYKVVYMRCCERKHFKFANGNILRTSKEKVITSLGGNKESETDIFIKNLDLDKTLTSRKWELDEIIDMIGKQIEFFDTMLKYLM